MNLENLDLRILKKYRSISNPNFSFVDEALKLLPYQAVSEELSRGFTVEDVTDPNDDVCFRFELSMNDMFWILELSMIGNFAALLRVVDQNKIELAEVPITSQEEVIFEILSQKCIVVFSKQVLESPFQMNLFHSDASNTRYYQVLFSDIEILPWKGSSSVMP